MGTSKIEQARRIKARQKNRPLSTLDFHGCQELMDYWRLRPKRKAGKTKPVKANGKEDL